MNRLPVFKALGDNTRYAIYLELARSAVSRSTAEVAEALDLHPNTVRPHLERMRDVGLLEVEVEGRGAVGRPQHRYSLAADAPSLGLEPAAFPLLARLLAGVAAAVGASPDDAAETGRVRGRAAGEARADAPSCVSALVDELAELGFDPALAAEGDAVEVAFTHCPYRELAEAFPDLVCHLHRGIVEGVVEGYGEAAEVEVTRFSTLVDRRPCRVELAVR